MQDGSAEGRLTIAARKEERKIVVGVFLEAKETNAAINRRGRSSAKEGGSDRPINGSGAEGCKGCGSGRKG